MRDGPSSFKGGLSIPNPGSKVVEKQGIWFRECGSEVPLGPVEDIGHCIDAASDVNSI